MAKKRKKAANKGGRPTNELILDNQRLRNEAADMRAELQLLRRFVGAVANNRRQEVLDILNELPSTGKVKPARRTFTQQFRRAFVAEVARKPKQRKHMLERYAVKPESYYQWCREFKKDRPSSTRATVRAPDEPAFEVLGD